MRRIFFVFLFSVLAFVITSSIAYSANRVTLQLNWKYQFEFAGYIAAKEKGFYKQEGLDVRIRQYNGGDVIEDVIKGKADFGVAGSSFFPAILSGKRIVLLANFFKKSPLVLVVKPYIFTPDDLQNKTLVYNAEDLNMTDIELLIKKFHIKFRKTIEENNNDRLLEAFVNGKTDAITAYITDQTYILNKLKIRYNVIDPANYGIFSYSGNLFTSMSFLKKHKDIVDAFIYATIKGWRYALKHPLEIAKIIKTRYRCKKSLEALMFEADKIRNIIMPNSYPVGSINISVLKNILSSFNDILKFKKSEFDLNNIYNYVYLASILTEKELNFIDKHKIIKICINPDWRPIEYIENNKPRGISIAVLKNILKSMNMSFKLVKTKSWKESQEYLKRGICDLLPSATVTEQRLKYAVFTKPYLTYRLFIFAKNNKPFVYSLNDLKGKTVARKEGSGLIQILKSKYPRIRVITTKTYEDMFRYVENNRAYCTIATLPVAKYYIERLGLHDIAIIGETEFIYPLSIEVRKNLKILRDILDEALSKTPKITISSIISKETKKQLLESYKKQYLKDILKITIISVFVVFVMFLIIYIILEKNEELSKIKQQLEESLNNFEIITKYSMQMVVIYKNGVCIDVNDVACKILGYKKEELIGKNVYDIVDKRYIPILEEKLKLDHTEPYELALKAKDGSLIYTVSKGDYIILNGEKVRLGTAFDITELKLLQEKLKDINEYLQQRIREETEKNLKKDMMIMQQSKYAATGEMFAMIAHQWRQPLNAISATINNLLVQLQLGSFSEKMLREKLSNIMTYIKHLSETIDDFRMFFKADTKKEYVSIKDIINQILKIIGEYIESKNIKIDLVLNCDKKVYINSNELKHVVLNLINNAKDAIEEKKPVNPYIRIETQCKDDFIEISVEDNAGGIPEDIMPHIFEAYFTTKENEKGTGLGLYIAKIIVEEHMEGSIEVKNTQSGARFTIILPLKT